MMRTGDTKQAIGLAFVAMLAIGFLAYRLIPKEKSLHPLLASSGREVDHRTLAAGSDLPSGVIGNPFSHAKLAVSEAMPASREAPPKVEMEKGGGFNPIDLATLPGAELLRAAGAAPEESAGSSRQQEQEPRIALKAILRVDEPLALLAVEDKKADLFKSGDELAPDVKVLSIGQSSITLSIFGKERRLQVGDSLGKSEKQ